jgi:glycine betaine/proline transport system permease protein
MTLPLVGVFAMDWLFNFPQIDPGLLLAVKRSIDGSLRALTRVYGDDIESFFYPLQRVLIFFEKIMTSSPWPVVVLALALVAWFASQRWSVVAAVIGTLIAIGLIGLWRDTMKTISLVLSSTIFAIAIGIPIGIVMNRFQRIGGGIQTVLRRRSRRPSSSSPTTSTRR